MRGTELCDELKKQLSCRNDSELAKKIGVTPARISQLRGVRNLEARALARFIKRAGTTELRSAIRPIVEFFPIDDDYQLRKRGRFIPFDGKTPAGRELRKNLQATKGIYSFYNSQGEIIYFGKTEKLNLYGEIVNAFNRRLSRHTIYRVRHPWGRYKTSKKGDLRKIRLESLRLYDSAFYFSAYDVSIGLIGSLESIVIRLVPNDMINVKIESKDMKAFSQAKL